MSIQQYRIEVVLDEQTTNRCLHGNTFSVADALRRCDRIERLEDPMAIKQAMPRGREAQDRETGRTRLYVGGGGDRTDHAEVPRAAMGTRDDRDVGIGFPPYGLSRSTTR